MHTFVSRNIDSGRSPPLRHGEDKESHSTFGVGHEAVVPLTMEDVERRPDILGYSDADGQIKTPCREKRMGLREGETGLTRNNMTRRMLSIGAVER